METTTSFANALRKAASAFTFLTAGILFFAGVAAILIGVLAKVQHYSFGNPMIMIGLVLEAVALLSLAITIYYRNRNRKPA